MINFLKETAHFSHPHDPTPSHKLENNGKRSHSDLALTYQAFLSLTADLCCIVHENGNIQEVNASFMKILGYSEEEVLQHPLINFIHFQDITQFKPLLSTHNKSSKKPTSVSYRFKKKNGRYLCLKSKCSMVSGNDQEKYFIICSQNITQEKKRTQLIHDQHRQIETYKEELENFTYLASHDLQEPLRVITSYLQLLEKRYKNQLDRDATDFIQYTVDGADRMKVMIQDLLVYSRINRKYQDEELVDLNKILEGVQNKLKNEFTANKVAIHTDQLPTVQFNASLMGYVWQNLISNAIKFRSEEEVKIDIRVREQAKQWLIMIHDNGKGIEKKYYQRIFEPFERLHGRKYAGTGMGLPIVKKILERYKGRIWVEAQPGQGTTFYFTLRKS